VDEARPGKTIIKPIELRRITKKNVISTGKERDIQFLIVCTR
jgi:hypothetical protein